MVEEKVVGINSDKGDTEMVVWETSSGGGKEGGKEGAELDVVEKSEEADVECCWELSGYRLEDDNVVESGFIGTPESVEVDGAVKKVSCVKERKVDDKRGG